MNPQPETGVPAENLQPRARAAVVRALRLRNAEGVLLKMGATPGWDSMGHMAVVIELEKEFGVRFPPFRLPELIDIDSIVKVLGEK